MQINSCKTCGELKQLAKSNKNCYDCYNARRRELANGAERQKVGAKKKYPNMESKKCTKCKKIKLLSEYCIKTYYKGGYNSQCRQCAALYQRGNKPPKPPHKEGTKACNTCNEEKEYKFFSRSKSGHDGYVVRCKLCQAEAANKNKKVEEINYAKFYYPIEID
jgi:hypothetical protein